MKRRRIAQLEAEMRAKQDAIDRMNAVIAQQAQRIERLKAERDHQATRRAFAEADRSGMCPDRPTCLATCSAADAWRNQQREAS